MIIKRSIEIQKYIRDFNPDLERKSLYDRIDEENNLVDGWKENWKSGRSDYYDYKESKKESKKRVREIKKKLARLERDPEKYAKEKSKDIIR